MIFIINPLIYSYKIQIPYEQISNKPHTNNLLITISHHLKLSNLFTAS